MTSRRWGRGESITDRADRDKGLTNKKTPARRRAPGGHRVGLRRFAALTVTVLFIAIGAFEGVTVIRYAVQRPDVTLGLDVRLYVEHAERWLAGGGFYMAEQARPYVVESLWPYPPLYPPVVLYLLVPLVWGVPWPVWWLVPLGLVAAAVIRRRPAWWQWPLLAAVLVYPKTWMILVYGNPTMWALAFLAAGMIWGMTPFAALKLTYAPLALIGVRRRAWWASVGIGLLLALPFGAMWSEFGAAILNASTAWGAWYTLGDVPIAVLLAAGLYAKDAKERRAVGTRPARPRDDGSGAGVDDGLDGVGVRPH